MAFLSRPSLRARITLGVLMLLFGAAFFLIIVLAGTITPAALANPSNIPRIRAILIGVTAFVFLLLAYGFWRVAGLVVYPLRELRDAVGFLAAGDLRNMEFLKAQENGALGAITESFRKVAHDLGDALHKIRIGAASALADTETMQENMAEAARQRAEIADAAEQLRALAQDGTKDDAQLAAQIKKIEALAAAQAAALHRAKDASQSLSCIAESLQKEAASFKL